MKVRFKLSALLAVLLTISTALTITAAADGIGFSANAVLPKNQAPGVGGYFNLRVEPGQTQDLQVQVNNSSDKDITVTVEAFTASTGSAGDVNYTSEGRVDETMRHKFADLAEVKTPRITVPPNSTETATITVTMPGERFDGVVLGSIVVLKELTDEDYNSGNAIINQYSYAMAVRLTETEAETFPAPDFVLGDVRAELDSGIAAVVCELRNIQPLLVKDVAVDAQILPKGGGDAVLAENKPNVNMAPNSVFSYSLRDDAGRGLKSGNYIARITMTYNDRDWVFEREFSIAADEATQINENSYNQQEASTLPEWLRMALWIGGGVLLLILLLIGIFFLRMRRQNREIEQLMLEQMLRQQSFNTDK